MIDSTDAALLIIDMQNGFIEEGSPLRIAGAQATIPNCGRALAKAREEGIPVIYVTRDYAADGSDVEAVRYRTWLEGGKPVSAASSAPGSLDVPESIAPHPQDYRIVKPRFSSFLGTKLDALLRSLSKNTVILIGTTTPNCVRATCYDALSLGYNTIIIEDCTSSRTPEVQKANIEDMAYVGAQIMDVDTFCATALGSMRDVEGEYRAALKRM